MEGFKSDPEVGSYTNAVFMTQPEYLRDTFTDDRWENIRRITRDSNFCSYRSMSIKAKMQKPLEALLFRRLNTGISPLLIRWRWMFQPLSEVYSWVETKKS